MRVYYALNLTAILNHVILMTALLESINQISIISVSDIRGTLV